MTIFEYQDLRVELAEDNSSKTFLKGELVYEDASYKPSPMYNWDNTMRMVSLLDFLTLRKGDTDDSFFEKRNCPALDEWAESYQAEEIKCMVLDYEGAYGALEEYCENNDITPEEALAINNYLTLQ